MKLNIVPPRSGIQWVRLGLTTFFRQPLALSSLFLMYMMAVLAIGSIPMVGPIVAGVLVPAATLGLMVASQLASQGKFPMPTVLVAAFRAGRERAGAMLVLGVVYTLASTGMNVLGTLLAGNAPKPTPNEIDVATLLVLALHIPVFILFWHAPALVHWHGISPAKSLFFSTVAFLRNLPAMLVYGFAWMGVFLGAGMVVGLLGGLAGGVDVARAVMAPVAMLVAAMFSTSIYFTFRDSFLATEGAPTPSPDGDTP